MTKPIRALVTGGSAGLGKALCDGLLADGFEVVCLDCDPPAQKTDASYLSCDLSDRRAVDSLVENLSVAEPFDVVVFNAGISATGKFEDISAPSHARVIAINAEAPMVICAALAKSGRIAENGHIAFVSSLSHFTGYPGAASYAASKDAVAIYANSVRKTFKRKFGISVTTTFPGPLKTDHAARHAPEGADAEKRMTPERAAALILADIRKGRKHALPGAGAKLFAMIGRLAPRPITYAMKKIIYDKLDKTVAD